MKRILVIDESEVIRETLALILGREFAVVKRPPSSTALPLANANEEEVDLLIFGVGPQLVAETANLLKFAARAPFAVLFLVDSKSATRAIENRDQVGWLAKPFNPYELKTKVGQLLAERAISLGAGAPLQARLNQELPRYLDYPYLNRAAASLVGRFAATQLPLLVWGEMGCGQEHVARAIAGSPGSPALRIFINAAELSSDYLEQMSFELASLGGQRGATPTLLIENLDKSRLSGQSVLVNFLEQEKERHGGLRLLTTANGDLLERVYQGDFLDALYYRLATLTLRLPPLRDRREDIPAIAAGIVRRYALNLGLGEVIITAGANERLSNYLWFANLSEMETVLARTLACHRKSRIEAADLMFDFSSEAAAEAKMDFEEFVPSQAPAKNVLEPVSARPEAGNGVPNGAGSAHDGAKSVDLNVVIHELAHELKNPMVTIKTFAQLLGDRYQDENFRARFQDVVGGDIDRMDDLLEVMIEFADFAQPRGSKVPLEEKLRTALKEVSAECAKRQARIQWKGNGQNREIQTDEAQLRYILRNVLLAVLSQAKMGSEIDVDVERHGCVEISYLREGARVASITHYLSGSAPEPDKCILPLRILLAKHLVERNGGRMAMEPSGSERDILRMEFPIAERGKEN